MVIGGFLLSAVVAQAGTYGDLPRACDEGDRDACLDLLGSVYRTIALADVGLAPRESFRHAQAEALERSASPVTMYETRGRVAGGNRPACEPGSNVFFGPDGEHVCVRSDGRMVASTVGSDPQLFVPAGAGSRVGVWPSSDGEWAAGISLGSSYLTTDVEGLVYITSTSDEVRSMVFEGSCGRKPVLENDTVAIISDGDRRCGHVFFYSLETGLRLPERDLELMGDVSHHGLVRKGDWLGTMQGSTAQVVISNARTKELAWSGEVGFRELVAISPDGRLVLGRTYSKHEVWTADAEAPLVVFDGACALARGDLWCAVHGEDEEVLLHQFELDVEPVKETVHTFSQHFERVLDNDLALSSDGMRVAWGSWIHEFEGAPEVPESYVERYSRRAVDDASRLVGQRWLRGSLGAGASVEANAAPVEFGGRKKHDALVGKIPREAEGLFKGTLLMSVQADDKGDFALQVPASFHGTLNVWSENAGDATIDVQALPVDQTFVIPPHTLRRRPKWDREGREVWSQHCTVSYAGGPLVVEAGDCASVFRSLSNDQIRRVQSVELVDGGFALTVRPRLKLDNLPEGTERGSRVFLDSRGDAHLFHGSSLGAAPGLGTLYLGTKSDSFLSRATEGEVYYIAEIDVPVGDAELPLEAQLWERPMCSTRVVDRTGNPVGGYSPELLDPLTQQPLGSDWASTHQGELVLPCDGAGRVPVIYTRNGEVRPGEPIVLGSQDAPQVDQRGLRIRHKSLKWWKKQDEHALLEGSWTQEVDGSKRQFPVQMWNEGAAREVLIAPGVVELLSNGHSLGTVVLLDVNHAVMSTDEGWRLYSRD